MQEKWSKPEEMFGNVVEVSSYIHGEATKNVQADRR